MNLLKLSKNVLIPLALIGTVQANALSCDGVISDEQATADALNKSIDDVRPAVNDGNNSAVDSALQRIKDQQCGDMKSPDTNLLDNPFVYVDPNATAANCGAGFSLPGLPSFSGSGPKGFHMDLCKAVQAVSGDTMNKINSAMNKWRDKAVSKAESSVSNVIGKDATDALSGKTSTSDAINKAAGANITSTNTGSDSNLY